MDASATREAGRRPASLDAVANYPLTHAMGQVLHRGISLHLTMSLPRIVEYLQHDRAGSYHGQGVEPRGDGKENKTAEPLEVEARPPGDAHEVYLIILSAYKWPW